MTVSRYRNDPPINGGKIKATAGAVNRIRRAMRRGEIAFRDITLVEGLRLDQIAGAFYNDGRLWWIIAAASNIGWGLQVPPGTNVRVPTDISEIMRLV